MRNRRNRNNRRNAKPRIAVWLVDGLPRLMAADARIDGSPLAVAADTTQNRDMMESFMSRLDSLANRLGKWRIDAADAADAAREFRQELKLWA